ncbi:hypothetical protein V8E54_001534 [Elaphomyces granulatus]
MVNSEAMEKAIEVLKSQETPKYAEVARQFNLSRHTLMRRFKGQTLPRAEAVSLHLKTKRVFWPLFRSAWEAALSKSNIKSAFASTGINPFHPEKVLKFFNRRTPSPPPSDEEGQKATPMSVRAVRRTVKAIVREENIASNHVDHLIRAAQKLSIEKEILEHENKSLRRALIDEKNRRKRGKPMGLIDKDRPGQAQFFSPTKVATARAKAAEIEAQKEAERLTCIHGTKSHTAQSPKQKSYHRITYYRQHMGLRGDLF